MKPRDRALAQLVAFVVLLITLRLLTGHWVEATAGVGWATLCVSLWLWR